MLNKNTSMIEYVVNVIWMIHEKYENYSEYRIFRKP